MDATTERNADLSRDTLVSLVFGFVVGGSAIVAVRRAIGALDRPLPAGMLMATGLAIAALLASNAAVCHMHGWRRRRIGTWSQDTQLAGWGPLAAVILSAAAFSWPFARLVDWAVWLPVTGAAWLLARPRTTLARSAAPTTDRTTAPTTALSDASDATPPESVLQQFTRVRDPSTGNESIFGTLCAEFLPQQRIAVLHVGFCPPLPRAPDVEAESADGTTVARVTQSLPQGARIEVRAKTANATTTTTHVDFAATCELQL